MDNINDVIPFTISENGFFCSTLVLPTNVIETLPKNGKITIPRLGDTILRIWADSDFSFKIGDCDFTSEKCEDKYQVKFFEGGLSLVGQYGGNINILTNNLGKVNVEFENYNDHYRGKLARFNNKSYPIEGGKGGEGGISGVKLHSNNGDYFIGHKNDPGHTVNSLYKLV